eukprot:3244382-Rhodomonas_salina.1
MKERNAGRLACYLIITIVYCSLAPYRRARCYLIWCVDLIAQSQRVAARLAVHGRACALPSSESESEEDMRCPPLHVSCADEERGGRRRRMHD